MGRGTVGKRGAAPRSNLGFRGNQPDLVKLCQHLCHVLVLVGHGRRAASVWLCGVCGSDTFVGEILKS